MWFGVKDSYRSSVSRRRAWSHAEGFGSEVYVGRLLRRAKMSKTFMLAMRTSIMSVLLLKNEDADSSFKVGLILSSGRPYW